MLAALLLAAALDPAAAVSTSVIAEPPAGKLYHGVFPGGRDGMGGDIAPPDVLGYQQLVGKRPAWVYFCNNWYQSRDFPMATATWIRANGSIPYIRLMLLHAPIRHPDPLFTLENILRGRLDRDFRRWMRDARRFATPLLAEYGVEVNGFWFPWNGLWNREGGSYADSVARFRAAYRHIIRIAREEGAHNIRWVFHVDPWDEPVVDWNRFENYYPGDEWIDWFGVSVYGRQIPKDRRAVSFRWQMDWVYDRLGKLADKPIVVSEFGNIKDPSQVSWASDALSDITGGRWPKLIGFSWWNSAFFNDPDPAQRSNMRIQDSPGLAAVFRKYVGRNDAVLSAPLLTPARER
jgi:Glycosyl hydrolase family 26